MHLKLKKVKYVWILKSYALKSVSKILIDNKQFLKNSKVGFSVS